MKNPRPVPVRPQPSTAPHVARAAFAAFFARSKIKTGDRDLIAAELFPDDEVTPLILKRAAVEGASTTGWAAELAQVSYQAFLQSLAPLSAASRLIPLGLTVSFDGAKEVTIPARQGAPVILPWVNEVGAIPVRAAATDVVTVGPSRKFATILVLSVELAKRSQGEAIFRTMLEEDAAVSLDAAYFGTQAGSPTVHPGLLSGVTAIPASQAGGLTAMREDLAAAIAAVTAGGSGQVALVMSHSRVASLSLFAPDLDVQVYGSAAVPDDRVVAVDPRSLFHGTSGIPDIDASSDATLHMNDAPTQISTAGSPSVVAAPTQSMFQTNQIAVRVIGDVAFGKRRADAVAYVDGVDWTANA